MDGRDDRHAGTRRPRRVHRHRPRRACRRARAGSSRRARRAERQCRRLAALARVRRSTPVGHRRPSDQLLARVGTREIMNTHTVIDSPVGQLTLVAANGVLAGLYMEQQRHRPLEETFGLANADGEPFAEVAGQLKEYFAGQRREFDLPFTFSGTPFQQRVWTALREVPYGETVSYGQLADIPRQPPGAGAGGALDGN